MASSFDPSSTQGEPAKRDVLAEVGAVRSIHTAPALLRSLAPAFVSMAAVLCVSLAFVEAVGISVLFVELPFAAIAFGLMAWTPLRMRKTSVVLHENGLVVTTNGFRDVVAFGDVDEVWLELDPARTAFGTLVWVTALRLVLHDKTRHVVPMRLERGAELCSWVLRNCSTVLRADALRSLAAGETLTFGEVSIDRNGIRGPSWSSPWKDLSLVRASPESLQLYRGQRLFSWRKIRFDAVPHPTVFLELVKVCVPWMELDNPLDGFTN